MKSNNQVVYLDILSMAADGILFGKVNTDDYLIEAIPISWLLEQKEKCQQPLGKAIYETIIDDWKKERENERKKHDD